MARDWRKKKSFDTSCEQCPRVFTTVHFFPDTTLMTSVSSSEVLEQPSETQIASAVLIEDLLSDANDPKALRTLRDDIIMDEKIDKRSALLISSLSSCAELMLLDLQFKKDKEIQETRHELALLNARISERDMLQSLCSDINKLTCIVQENSQKIEQLESNVLQLTQLTQSKKK